MDIIRFQPRWKEEIVATSRRGKLVFEMTMGIDHVYFPSQVLWEKNAPEWAKPMWEEYMNACIRWCNNNSIPFTLADNTFMYEERK
ncbi:MAG: hypothetical protein WBP58_14470 [Chitinophagaceae bacterium]